MTSSPVSFESIKVSADLCRALASEGYSSPTPIQHGAIPALLDGRDLLGCAQTGTGKTAAFALPLLQRLAADRKSPGPKGARVLVLVPTRELALQVAERFTAYARFVPVTCTVLLGGVGQGPQVKALARGVDVLVATPGRLLDLMNQGHARMDRVEALVLDEADRMLDMGFINDVRRVLRALPRTRQTVLLSATMPPEIRNLAKDMLRNPVEVTVAPVSSTAEGVAQFVLFVRKENKRALLQDVLRDPAMNRALIFTRTKRGANRLAEQLTHMKVGAEVIHGNKSQNARVRALEAFRSGRSRVLVATDIAARGIDVDDVSHVINFELPDDPESYVHRIGRTARAGKRGVALSFCDADERVALRDIEKLTGRKLRVVEGHPFATGTSTGRVQ